MVKKNIKISELIILCLISIFSFSCSSKKKSSKLQIVCTTTMITDMVKKVVGDKCEVVGLMNAGVDPHAYKPTSKDVSLLNLADIIFHNGLHLEGKMSDALSMYAKSGRHCYAISSKIKDDELIFDKNIGKDSVDPHIWFDPNLWINCLKNVVEILCKIDVTNAEFYKKNGENYTLELEELKEYLSIILSRIPEEQRILISAHDAFSYFGRFFNMRIIGLQGISTVSECGMKDIEDMVKFITDNNVKAIFLETSVPETSIMSVVEGCKMKGFKVKIGGHLFSDALGDIDKPEGTYIGMMKHNAEILVNSLR